jgi:methylphosphotriester-DNA--protein-cysteine methyltransferase
VRIVENDSVEGRVQAIKAQIAVVQQHRARRQVELDTVKASLAHNRNILKEEFGVDTVEQARARLTELEEELEQALLEVEQALSEVGQSADG